MAKPKRARPVTFDPERRLVDKARAILVDKLETHAGVAEYRIGLHPIVRNGSVTFDVSITITDLDIETAD